MLDAGGDGSRLYLVDARLAVLEDVTVLEDFGVARDKTQLEFMIGGAFVMLLVFNMHLQKMVEGRRIRRN